MEKKVFLLIILIISSTIFISGCLEQFQKYEPQNTELIEYFIFKETNRQRTLNSLEPLKINPELVKLARDHSKDMLERDYLSHINPEGEDPSERAKNYNIPEKKPLGDGFFLVGIGENIGEISPGNIANLGGMYVENTPEGLAEAQVTLWMNSPEHRDNILNNNYTEIGIGTVYNSSTQNYITTQNFR